MSVKGFVEGGLASIFAGWSTHPLDLIKVRMQLHGESSAVVHRPPGVMTIGLKIFRHEGPAALLSGASATVLRQALYSTTRMGVYDTLKATWSDPNTNTMTLTRKIAAGFVAGAFGAAVGNPADVAMVRMQADGRLPAVHRRNYKSVSDAMMTMARTEGIGSLWRGSSLAVNRAMLITAAQLSSYDQIKEMILEQGLMRDGVSTHVAASFSAGFMAAVVSNPMDVIKTRVMNMKVVQGLPPPYKGPLDCAIKTVRSEGPLAFYKGLVPSIWRLGSYTVMLFVTLEQLRMFMKHV